MQRELGYQWNLDDGKRYVEEHVETMDPNGHWISNQNIVIKKKDGIISHEELVQFGLALDWEP